eukprot:tig00000180_g13629.t1
MASASVRQTCALQMTKRRRSPSRDDGSTAAIDLFTPLPRDIFFRIVAFCASPLYTLFCVLARACRTFRDAARAFRAPRVIFRVECMKYHLPFSGDVDIRVGTFRQAVDVLLGRVHMSAARFKKKRRTAMKLIVFKRDVVEGDPDPRRYEAVSAYLLEGTFTEVTEVVFSLDRVEGVLAHLPRPAAFALVEYLIRAAAASRGPAALNFSVSTWDYTTGSLPPFIAAAQEDDYFIVNTGLTGHSIPSNAINRVRSGGRAPRAGR